MRAPSDQQRISAILVPVYVVIPVGANNVEAIVKELGVDASAHSNGNHSELLRVPRVMLTINSREKKIRFISLKR